MQQPSHRQAKKIEDGVSVECCFRIHSVLDGIQMGCWSFEEDTLKAIEEEPGQRNG